MSSPPTRTAPSPQPTPPTPPKRRRVLRWLLPALAVLVWLGAGGAIGPYAGKLGEVAVNDQSAFLPQSAESTRVSELQDGFSDSDTLPLIVVWESESGTLDRSDAQAATEALASVAGVEGVEARPSPAIPSEDGEALQGVVQLQSDLDEELEGVLGEIREATAESVPDATVQLAGPAATQADLTDAFAGIDGILLGVALAVVLLILLLVYRSVLLPLVIIVSSVFALSLASFVVYKLAQEDLVSVDGQVQGILSILVIGAATDYALLLSARFREELTAQGDKFAAMRTAVRQSWGAIAASAATVALGLLALLLSDLANNRALGPVGAIGIVCAVISTLTFLPAALALLGRAAYWPARPKVQSSEEAADPEHALERQHGIWHRVARTVDRRPRRVWAVTLVVLAAFAAFFPTLKSEGVPISEIFVNDAKSVTAQETLSEHFPGGSGNPAVVIAEAGDAEEVARTLEGTEGVASVVPFTESGPPGQGEPKVVDGRVRLDATLEDGADSDAAKETVQRMRDELGDVAGGDALVGGYTAQQYDTQKTASEDRAVITPVVLAIILIILIVLLRALLLPVLLMATVALNYLATLGVSALVFKYLFGFTGTDASVPLYGFVFLVALGVDYNIFLMTRVREEALTHGNRIGVMRGLTATGGVITSAGVVLAATFAALVVIPLAFLAQIAFIVAFGVLMDTLIVRSLLVPALTRDIGGKVWWPKSLAP